MKTAIALLPAALLFTSSAQLASSQGMPTSQPNLISIVREEVKLGHGAAHAAHEAGWPAAYAKAKFPDYYLAMVSMTGPNEAWYVSPYASHSALGESMKRESADPVLTAELARLTRLDGDHLTSSRTVHAAARTDLSYGAFPDMGLTRFWEITTFRVRPGFEESFAGAAKAFAAAAKRATPAASWRVYEVLAGMPGPTYFVFGSMKSFADFDKAMEENGKQMKAFTPDELAMLQKFASTGMISSETQRFRLDPKQSYVDAATKAKDAAFWSAPAQP